MSDYPIEFKNVIDQLDALSNSEGRIYTKVNQFKLNLLTYLDKLKRISSDTIAINDKIQNLKTWFSDLKEQNKNLQRELEIGRTNFDNQISELKSQKDEFEKEKQRLENEKNQFEQAIKENIEMSIADKESAIRKIEEAADEKIKQQNELMKKNYEEERSRLVSEYQNDYNGLLKALQRIAGNQSEAINQIDAELQQSEKLTNEFSSVHEQIVGLLNSITLMLNNPPLADNPDDNPQEREREREQEREREREREQEQEREREREQEQEQDREREQENKSLSPSLRSRVGRLPPLEQPPLPPPLPPLQPLQQPSLPQSLSVEQMEGKESLSREGEPTSGEGKSVGGRKTLRNRRIAHLKTRAKKNGKKKNKNKKISIKRRNIHKKK